MKLTKRLINLIDTKTNCSVCHYDNEYFSICVDNACDEDYQIEIDRNPNEVEDILNHCDDYDFEEHFDLWRGANRGEPSSAYMLLKNCEEIGENLEQLADTIREAIKVSEYQLNKGKARQQAMDWQRDQALYGCDYLTLFKMQEKFIRLGKRYGLLKEFREEGII